jgi:hypothetical protein
MKTAFTLLLATLCAATSYGQTIKALGYNTTNGQVVYSGTNTLNFSNAFTVAGNLSVTTSGISGYGGTLSFEEALFNANGGDSDWALGGSGFTEAGVIAFLNPTNAAITRTNLGLGATWLTNGNVTNFRTAIGLPLPALTNASNVTIMRALAGSTSTNEPYSGTFDFQDFADNTVRLTISNGIILKIEFP